ncbi:MAG: helix-turn-helix transcriptional regulator [Atopobiaceae bacterium]|nr:helix-turn-helix transcriptional regulator [Atopobiaceae bacterium]
MKAADYDLRAVGNRLKSGLIDNGMTMDDLSKMTGMSIDSISAWIRGASAMTLDSAIKVCDALNWPMDRLLRRREYADEVA